MTTYEYSSNDGIVSASFSIVRSAIGIAIDVVLWLPRFWKARSELGDLAAMTERDCRDIGLTGCEIECYLTPHNRLQRRAPLEPGLEDRRSRL
jgi:uncharacterized protein YjiS (DUF1127 family)